MSTSNSDRTAGRYVLLFGSTFALLCSLHVLLFSYQIGAPVQSEYWLQGVRAVKQFFAGQITAPKLLILGGSNALFGLDAKQIERELGKPTVNLATHGGFPLAYYFAEAEPHLRAGDSVLLALEYEQYQRTSPYGGLYTSVVMTWLPEEWEALSWRERIRFMRAVGWPRVVSGVLMQSVGAGTAAAKRRERRTSDELLGEWKARREQTESENPPYFQMYSPHNVDEHGDVIRIEGAISRNDDYHFGLGLPKSEFQWELLAQFYEWCKKAGVRVWITWPPLLDNPALDLHAPHVKAHLAKITRRIEALGIPILGKPEDFLYSRDLFSDTQYHLNARGRAMRTETIIQHLRANRLQGD